MRGFTIIKLFGLIADRILPFPPPDPPDCVKLDVQNIVEEVKNNKRDFTDEQKRRVETRILDHLHSWARDPSWRKAIEDSVREALSDVVPEKAANLTSLLLRGHRDWNTKGESNFSHLKSEKLPDEDPFTTTAGNSEVMDEAIKLANRAKNLRKRRNKMKRRKLSRPSRSKIHTLSTMRSTGSNASSSSSNFGSPNDGFDGLFSKLLGFNPFNLVASMFVGSEIENKRFQSGNSGGGRSSGGNRNYGYRAGETSSNCNRSSCSSTSRKRKRHALDGYRLEPISDETIRLAVELLAREGIGEAEDLVRNAAFGDYGDILDEEDDDDDVISADDLCDLCKGRGYPACMKCRRFTMKSSRKTVKKSRNIHGFSA